MTATPAPKGPYIKDVRKIFGILNLHPLVRILARSIRVNPRNLPYYVSIWGNPSLPLCADVLYEWSLMQMSFMDGLVSHLSRLEASSPALQSPLMTLPRLEKGMGMPISSEKVGTRSTWSTEVELWSLKLSLKWYNTLSIVCMG